MAANVGKNSIFNSVKFDVTLDLEDFETLSTDTFYVRGNPWAIKFQKSLSENGISILRVYLHTKIDEKCKSKAVVGSCELEIPSNKFDGKSHVVNIEPHSFEPGRGWGYKKLICWDDLMDPNNGYVYNGKCRIAVNVKASPLQLSNDEKWLEIVPIKEFRDCCTKAEFQIKIKEVFGFVDVCSPRFTLKHSPWRLIVFKNVITTKNDKNEDNLRIKLYSPSLFSKSEESFKVSMTCKLFSSESAVEPFSKKFENQEFNGKSTSHSLDMLSWNELMNPQKNFVQNNSFTLKVTIEVKDEDDDENDDKTGAITLECPICFAILVDQPLSVLICGHIYCTDCIVGALEKKRICPSCNQDIPEGELQKVYLPTK